MSTVLDLSKSSLPVIQRPIDNTALQAYMACPREYAFSMILHRRSKGESAALSFGGAWHKALETHYRYGGIRALVQAEVEKYWKGGIATDYRTKERVLLDYDKYVKEYGMVEQNGKTVGFPDAPLVEISTNAQGGGLIHPWAGKIDRIIQLGALYYIEDHKTTSRLDKHYFRQFGLSYQMKGYTFLGRQLLPEMPIAGVRINLSHVLTGKTEFHRQLFTYSKDQMEEWVRNTNSWMNRLGDDLGRYNKLIDEGWDSFNALMACFPAHWGDNGCSRKFGMCTYHDVCESGPSIRKQLLERDYEINEWNPLDVDDE